jgi:HK97 family phage major capsid protein/HK97 family phage prohead protease
MPLLFHHDQSTPVGEITHAELRNGQWHVRGTIRQIAEPGFVKDITDRAWHNVKYKLMRGLSIGFKPLKQKANRFIEWAWHELSIVTLPSNSDCTVSAVRSAFQSPATRSAPVYPVGTRVLPLVSHMPGMKEMVGTVKIAREGSPPYYGVKFDGMDKVHKWYAEDELKAVVDSTEGMTIKSSAASGDPSQVPASRAQTIPPRPGKMTIAEQITQHENSRAAKVAQRDALLEKAGVEGRTLDTSESETFDTLDTEIRSIDAHLVRLNSAKSDNAAKATPVTQATTIARAAETRSGAVGVVSVKPNATPGIQMARHAMVLAQAKGNKFEAARIATQYWGDSASEVVANLEGRAAIAAGTTTTSGWALPLVQTNYVNEFLEMLRPMTLIGRIPGLRHVPFNVSMPAQTAGGTYAWVGEGAPKPVTKPTYASVTLTKAKAAGIIVLTKELVRLSTPAAQEAVRDEMLSGIQQFLDGQFIDTSIAAVANVNPASITNGVAGTVASGTDVAAARADISARVAAFAAANYGLGGLVMLMNESVAFTLGSMINSVGQPAFPGLSINGGSILGIPVVTSETVGAQIILVHAPSVLIADEGGIEIDASEEASVQMDSAPTDPADASTVLTSFWQHNLVGLRVERLITWGKARSTAVDRIHTVAYVA